MNLLCPNCQKMLTVPEEYAGQLMQCPLCRGTFTMPAMPSQGGAPKPPAPTPPPPPDTFTIPLPPSGVFLAPPELKPSTPPPAGGRPPVPLRDSSLPMEPVMMPGPAAGYRHAIPLRFNPAFLRWLVPVCLILVLVLSFFAWIGSFPGGVTVVSQTGLQMAFGGWNEGQLLELARAGGGQNNPVKQMEPPKSSLWMIFGLLSIYLAVLLAVAFVVFNFLPSNSAPFIQGLRRWQGFILGAVCFLAFMFLVIDMIAGSQLKKTAEGPIEGVTKSMPQIPDEKVNEQMQQAVRGAILGAISIHHTLWFRLAFALLVLAFLGGFLEFWGTRRGNRPAPKIEIAW
jgi:hypothetical protein